MSGGGTKRSIPLLAAVSAAVERAAARWRSLRTLQHVLEAYGPVAALRQYRSAALGLTVALLAVAVALFSRLVLLAGLGPRLAYITLYPAVTLAALVGGYGAGALATVLSVLAASLWLAPLRAASDWLGMGIFLIGCALIVGVTEAMHRAQGRAAEAETEARLADAVRESEGRLKAVVETAADGIVTIDEKGIIQSFNPAAARQFGYNSEEVTGRSISLLMPEPHSVRHGQHLSDYLRAGKGEVGFGREVEGRRKDGAMLPIDLAVSETVLDGRRLFVGMLRDISERKRAEERQRELTEELRSSEAEARRQKALFEGVFKSAPEAILLIDMEQRITMVNPPFERLFGYGLDEIAGAATSKICADEEAWRPVANTVFGIVGGTGVEPQAAHFRRKDGELFPGEIVASLYADKDGVPLGYIGIIRDVTLERKREEALRRAQKLEVIGQLTGGVAHDFNNLLTIIVGNLELLEQQLDADPQRELLRKAFDAADMGQRLTHRLLTFARRQTLAPERTSLNQIVLDLTDMLRRTLGSGVELVTELHQTLWPALADRGQIESAILNLALNARDAMPRGGKLLIRTSNVGVDAAPVDGESLQPGRYVRLSVVDSGEGMSAPVKAHAFEPFFTTKDTGNGTGLGLATIYGFARQSGGTAAIESEVGKGTTVSLFLPADRSPVAAESGQVQVTGRTDRPRGLRVLVVEDNPRVRELTVTRVKTLGHEVLEAHDGRQALAILDRGEIVDMVFTDLIMPGGMSGLDLCEVVRAKWPHIRLLLTSGYADELSDSERLGRLKLKLLGKPYRQSELAKAIESAKPA